MTGEMYIKDDDQWPWPDKTRIYQIDLETIVSAASQSAVLEFDRCLDEVRGEFTVRLTRQPGGTVNARAEVRLYEGYSGESICGGNELNGRKSMAFDLAPGTSRSDEIKVKNNETTAKDRVEVTFTAYNNTIS
jgi:hypothetical protein